CSAHALSRLGAKANLGSWGRAPSRTALRRCGAAFIQERKLLYGADLLVQIAVLASESLINQFFGGCLERVELQAFVWTDDRHFQLFQLGQFVGFLLLHHGCCLGTYFISRFADGA